MAATDAGGVAPPLDGRQSSWYRHRAEVRTRIAREIHDTLAQGLTAIALQIEGGLNQLERDPPRARERLEQALALSRASLEEARRSVLDLRTLPLAGKSLVEGKPAVYVCERFACQAPVVDAAAYTD